MRFGLSHWNVARVIWVVPRWSPWKRSSILWRRRHGDSRRRCPPIWRHLPGLNGCPRTVLQLPPPPAQKKTRSQRSLCSQSMLDLTNTHTVLNPICFVAFYCLVMDATLPRGPNDPSGRSNLVRGQASIGQSLTISTQSGCIVSDYSSVMTFSTVSWWILWGCSYSQPCVYFKMMHTPTHTHTHTHTLTHSLSILSVEMNLEHRPCVRVFIVQQWEMSRRTVNL